MAKVNATGRSTGEARHVRLYEWELRSPAFRSLSCAARCLLLELKRRHIGTNNGYIPLSVREAADLLNRSRSKVQGVFAELQTKGFIRPRQKGSFDLKIRHSTDWILGEYPFGAKAATKEFMSWRPDEKQKPVPLRVTDSTPQGDRDSRTVPLRVTDGTPQGDRQPRKSTRHGHPQGDTDSLPGGEGEPAPTNRSNVDVLIERVARVKGLSHLKMTPTTVVAAFSAATRKRLLKRMVTADLTDGDLVRAAIYVANVGNTGREGAA